MEISIQRAMIQDCVDEECILWDGFDAAILGVARRCGMETVIAYDWDACVEILMQEQGLSREDAEEFLEFNVVGAYVGPYTPVLVERIFHTGGEGEPAVVEREERPDAQS